MRTATSTSGEIAGRSSEGRFSRMCQGGHDCHMQPDIMLGTVRVHIVRVRCNHLFLLMCIEILRIFLGVLYFYMFRVFLHPYHVTCIFIVYAIVLTA